MDLIKSYDTAWVIVNRGIPLPYTTGCTRSVCIREFMDHHDFSRKEWRQYRDRGQYECIHFRFMPMSNNHA